MLKSIINKFAAIEQRIFGVDSTPTYEDYVLELSQAWTEMSMRYMTASNRVRLSREYNSLEVSYRETQNRIFAFRGKILDQNLIQRIEDTLERIHNLKGLLQVPVRLH